MSRGRSPKLLEKKTESPFFPIGGTSRTAWVVAEMPGKLRKLAAKVAEFGHSWNSPL